MAIYMRGRGRGVRGVDTEAGGQQAQVRGRGHGQRSVGSPGLPQAVPGHAGDTADVSWTS